MYASLEKWKRYKFTIFGDKERKIDNGIFSVVRDFLKDKEIRNYKEKKSTIIMYNKIGEINTKKFWKRDDLLKKAEKYEQKQMLKSAHAQYVKILEMFPEDEETKKKVQRFAAFM